MDGSTALVTILILFFFFNGVSITRRGLPRLRSNKGRFIERRSPLLVLCFSIDGGAIGGEQQQALQNNGQYFVDDGAHNRIP